MNEPICETHEPPVWFSADQASGWESGFEAGQDVAKKQMLAEIKRRADNLRDKAYASDASIVLEGLLTDVFTTVGKG